MRACTGGERIQEACVTFILQSSRRSREFEGAGTITGGERGEKQVTNMVDSSYVGLFFLYQNIFKWLKKEHGKNVTGCGEFGKNEKNKEDFEKAGVSWHLGMFSVSVNAGVWVVHAVCERPWV